MSASNEIIEKVPDQLSIDQYAVIGNMKTCSLVGIDGSIDWCCFPNFNSPSVFAKILDCKKGGYFSVKPTTTDFIPKQHYWPDTNVLITKFLMDDGVGQVTDFMPIEKSSSEDAIVRRIEVVHGTLHFRMECFPAFNYALDSHSVKVNEEGTVAIFKSEKITLILQSSLPCLKISDSGVIGEVCLNSSHLDQKACTFALRQLHGDENERPTCLQTTIDKAMIDTIQYWQRWVNKISYQGRWREKVFRSALVMKLLTFAPTGAIVSSPSTSLPKVIGGSRNYDYRFTWIRDACFALNSFLQLGLFTEATNLMAFIEKRCLSDPPKPTTVPQQSDSSNSSDTQYTALSLGAPLGVMYNIDGSSKSVEEHAETLEHLAGFMNSRPVRIGNAASTHLEFDIFGELLDVVYQFDQRAAPISYEFWTRLRVMVNWVCDHWSKPDASIWEIRGVSQHFVHSKVMCWVAVDRALKLSLHRSLPSDRDRWLKVRDDIFEDVMKNGWNEEIGSFVQCYGSKTLDVSLLILPIVDFLSPQDPKIISTIRAINRSPKKGGLVSSTLVYRYDTSAVGSHEGAKEGTFNMCSMWLIQALTLAGKTESKLLHHAQLLFEQMLTYSNRVGLFSEQTSFSGKSLGNFPHCNTHSALVAAAISLSDALARSA